MRRFSIILIIFILCFSCMKPKEKYIYLQIRVNEYYDKTPVEHYKFYLSKHRLFDNPNNDTDVDTFFTDNNGNLNITLENPSDSMFIISAPGNDKYSQFILDKPLNEYKILQGGEISLNFKTKRLVPVKITLLNQNKRYNNLQLHLSQFNFQAIQHNISISFKDTTYNYFIVPEDTVRIETHFFNFSSDYIDQNYKFWLPKEGGVEYKIIN